MVILAGLALLALGLALTLGAWLLARRGRQERQALGLPEGRIVRADMGRWQVCPQPLFSARHRLAGRPDYLVQVGRVLVPVEAKPARRAQRPYEGDLLQLGAYLLLVHEAIGKRPPYGLLHYQGRTFEIPYTAALQERVLASLEEMRRLRGARDVPPQHGQPERCLRCGHRQHCGASLA
mgnify:CR=1 FL=1